VLIFRDKESGQIAYCGVFHKVLSLYHYLHIKLLRKMKKLEKLILNHLSKNALDTRQQNILKGGGTCYCTCSACLCSSWDGTGIMPPGQSSTDLGTGYVNAYSASSLGGFVY
jgi:natural product precursor